MTTSTAYPYDQGDRIETPNTYFYTAYAGRTFISAWTAARARAAGSLPPPAPEAPGFDPSAGEVTSEEGETGILLDRALAGGGREDDSLGRALTEKFLRKFEVTKRVHDAYGPSFRAVDPARRRSMALYVRLAELFEQVYSNSGDIRFLNGLLKAVDTISAAPGLSPDLGARTSRLIAREKEHVLSLMRRMGISP